MPIKFTILPEFDLVMYVFDGHFTAADYFQAYEDVYKDPRRHHGMKILMDLFDGAPEFDVADLKRGVALILENRQAGFSPDHVAMLTSSETLNYFRDTIELLAEDSPVFLQAFHTVHDAARWLELGDHEEEVNKSWQAFKNS